MSSAGALGLSFNRSAIFVFHVGSCFSDSLLVGAGKLPVDFPFFMTSNTLAMAGVSRSLLASPRLPLSGLSLADFFRDSVSHSISLWELKSCRRLSRLGVALPSVPLASLPSELRRLARGPSGSFPRNGLSGVSADAKTGKSLSLSVSTGRPSLMSSLLSSSASSPLLSAMDRTSGLSRLESRLVGYVADDVVE